MAFLVRSGDIFQKCPNKSEQFWQITSSYILFDTFSRVAQHSVIRQNWSRKDQINNKLPRALTVSLKKGKNYIKMMPGSENCHIYAFSQFLTTPINTFTDLLFQKPKKISTLSVNFCILNRFCSVFVPKINWAIISYSRLCLLSGG